MTVKEYLFYFTPNRLDRFRYYHFFESGYVVHFVIQYEALISGKWHPIVRYDTAHNRPHKDLIHPDGSQDKVEFIGHSREEVLTIGERDIKNNWQKYRQRFEQELNDNV
jgi:hypothetical protein